MIRLNHTTLLGHGLAEWFREWGQGCGAIDEIIFARGPLTRFGQDTLRHSCRRAILGSRLFAATSKGFRCLSFVKLDQAPPQSTMGNKQHTVRGPAAEGVAHNRSQDGAVSLNPSSRGRSQFWFVCYIYIYISVIELTDSINGGMGWVRVGGGVARRGTGCPRTGNEIESRICVLWMSMGQCISIDCS